MCLILLKECLKKCLRFITKLKIMTEFLSGKMDYKKIGFYLFLLTFVSCFSLSKISYSETGESVVTEGHSKEEINRGKRFFLGLLPQNNQHASCVSCHNVVPVDTLNWNPSAMEIAEKYAGKDFVAFEQVVMSPSGKKMSEVHKNFKISSED